MELTKRAAQRKLDERAAQRRTDETCCPMVKQTKRAAHRNRRNVLPNEQTSCRSNETDETCCPMEQMKHETCFLPNGTDENVLPNGTDETCCPMEQTKRAAQWNGDERKGPMNRRKQKGSNGTDETCCPMEQTNETCSPIELTKKRAAQWN
ncbi:hypothetical protein AVEN_146964-1 [Araneus ventricosus]|uniref:Uncharacterized protein n=1 Tax=Araneus ventricosus TaxID=182803 RepID=A0A4Y2TR66_ARAVE|nr:hypothetical protein AVEN_146964-1 [Araneus ventricosus]